MTGKRSVLTLAKAMFLVLVCLSVSVAPAVAQAQLPVSTGVAENIVSNGGFENWQPAPDKVQAAIDCTQLPTGWSLDPRLSGKNNSLSRDANVKYAGECSLCLKNTVTTGGIRIAQRMDADPETRYKVSIWIRGDHIDADFPKGIVVTLVASTQTNKDDPNVWAGNLFSADKEPSPNTGTFGWSELSFTFDTPVNTKTIEMFIALRGAGTVWLDDINVAPLEKCLQVESY